MKTIKICGLEEYVMDSFTSKKVDRELTRGLLDLVVLGMLKNKSVHGYGVITGIRKKFGIYFGPSTVYPLLKELEDKGYIKSEWDMGHDRPRKVFTLTSHGSNYLNGTQQSFRNICHVLNSMGINAPAPILNKSENVQIGLQRIL
jgi:PadR family transcriptional regulator, regulatory protein PadR